jgi:hypothetical protein
LRGQIAGEPSAGLFVTMSFEVSASEPGSFDFAAVFPEADRALYDGKRAATACSTAKTGMTDALVSARYERARTRRGSGRRGARGHDQEPRAMVVVPPVSGR